jgi:cysteine desulfurase
MGVPAGLIQGTVRFSLSRYNTEKEVGLVSDEMPRIVERLRGLSALGKAAAQVGEQRVPSRSLLH